MPGAGEGGGGDWCLSLPEEQCAWCCLLLLSFQYQDSFYTCMVFLYDFAADNNFIFLGSFVEKLNGR